MVGRYCPDYRPHVFAGNLWLSAAQHLRNAFWRNIPAAVWSYRLGGYQVLEKWLSYRERTVLGRPLRLEKIQQFADTARRIAAMSAAVKPKPS